jgi:hypothetical protein
MWTVQGSSFSPILDRLSEQACARAKSAGLYRELLNSPKRSPREKRRNEHDAILQGDEIARRQTQIGRKLQSPCRRSCWWAKQLARLISYPVKLCVSRLKIKIQLGKMMIATKQDIIMKVTHLKF